MTITKDRMYDDWSEPDLLQELQDRGRSSWAYTHDGFSKTHAELAATLRVLDKRAKAVETARRTRPRSQGALR